jgi:membrane-associated phospholipid phosphatase
MQTHVAWDHRISEALYKRGTTIPRIVWKSLEYTGDGLVWLAACFLALALLSTSRPARHLWANFLLGMILDLIEIGLVKALIRRPRPQHNLIAKDMNVIVAVDHFSFPSGHSSR